MKIYSIKEIVDATKNISDSDIQNHSQKKNYKNYEETITETKRSDLNIKENFSRENSGKNIQEPLVLKNPVLKKYEDKPDLLNFEINIKPEIKENIINEVYDFLKKKVKKNTLKIIIDSRLEIKNLQNKLNFLESVKNEITNNFIKLEKNYINLVSDYEALRNSNQNLLNKNNQLENDNKNINKILNEIKTKNEKLDRKNNFLSKENIKLEDKLNQLNDKIGELTSQNIELQSSIDQKDITFDITNQKNRSLEINNAELKNTVSRYIVNTKKITEKINTLEKISKVEIDEKNKKIQFYQDENVRLSSELLLSQNKNAMIKLNLTEIENEKIKISDKINELSKSINEKTNIISSDFKKQKMEVNEKLNDKEQKSLDDVIGRIFKKM